MKPGRVVSIGLAGLTLVLAATGSACRNPRVPAAEKTSMTLAWARVYTDSMAVGFDLSPDSGAGLAAVLGQLVGEAKGVLRLALDEERVQRYRAEGQGLEVEYAVPETLQYAGGTRTITPLRLFVIWGGDLVDESGESLVVLYGHPAYSAGPLKLPTGRTRLHELLAGLPRLSGVPRDSR